jgi:hypothetical protein
LRVIERWSLWSFDDGAGRSLDLGARRDGDLLAGWRDGTLTDGLGRRARLRLA